MIDASGGIAQYAVVSLKRYDTKTMPFGDILFAKGRPGSAEWITLMTAGGELDSATGNYLQSDVVVAERQR